MSEIPRLNTKWVVLLCAQLGMIVFLVLVMVFAPLDALSENFRSNLESTIILIIGSSIGQGATGGMRAAGSK